MKRLIILSIICIGLSSCQEEPSQNIELQQVQQEANVALINQYFEHFNNHEWEQMASMYADPAEFKDPSFGTESIRQTRVETVAKYSELNAIFSDLHDRVVLIYPSGNDHVIVEFISTGTAPDGSSFELPICSILTIQNGNIIKDYTYYDNFEEEEMEPGQE